MRLLPHPTDTRPTTPPRHPRHTTDHRPGPSPTGHICPRIRLTLHDGTERDYLLDGPSSCPRPQGPHATYEPRVHLAYVLARQGHGTRWLARFADLPLPAAERVTEAAARAGRT
ncbi:hypothetical protein ABT168_02090 [Streptomyces sp. NPDC001793]|uniref:hypothetical protein n=1 Tax=Streptomyces sp. NPDC001793 TaxID=3154657 RepID=UPI00332A6112